MSYDQKKSKEWKPGLCMVCFEPLKVARGQVVKFHAKCRPVRVAKYMKGQVKELNERK